MIVVFIRGSGKVTNRDETGVQEACVAALYDRPCLDGL